MRPSSGFPTQRRARSRRRSSLRSGTLTPEAVSAFVAEHVAPYKKLRAVEPIDEIPKTPSGKLLRRVLIERERAAAPPG
jgi:acyl-CoA synthetase (AMP-forming)/AMP-acid ligase II